MIFNIEIENEDEIPPSQDTDSFWHLASNKFSFHSTDKTGKWMIFIDKKDLDSAWLKVKKACWNGLLGPACKCSTARENPRQQDVTSAVIICYTRNWEEEEDLNRVADAIRDLGFTQKLFYKKDSATRTGIYGKNSWYVYRDATK